MSRIILIALLCIANFTSAKSYFVWSDELLEKLQRNDISAEWYVYGAVDSLVTNHNNLCVPKDTNPSDILDIVSAYLVKLKIKDQKMFPTYEATYAITMAMFDAYKCKN